MAEIFNIGGVIINDQDAEIHLFHGSFFFRQLGHNLKLNLSNIRIPNKNDFLHLCLRFSFFDLK